MLFFELDRPLAFADIIVSAGLEKGLRREAASKLERSRQAYDSRHVLFNHQPAPFRLKSRRNFLHCVEPLKEKSQPGERKRRNESSKRCHKPLAETSHLRKSCLQNQTQDGQCGDVSIAFVQPSLELKLS